VAGTPITTEKEAARGDPRAEGSPPPLDPRDPLVRLFRRIETGWSQVNETAEVWAVQRPWTGLDAVAAEKDFLASGVSEVAWLKRQLERAGLSLGGETALDFGCGPGRVTAALVPYFRSVIGVDVSPRMVHLAESLTPRSGACQFVVNARPDLATFRNGSFDLVYSCRVMQHFPHRLIRAYLDEFARVLRPGGVLALHVHGESTVRWANLLPPESVAFVYRQLDRRSVTGAKGGPMWEVHWMRPPSVVRYLKRIGFEVFGTVRQDPPEGRMIGFWYFAQRPGKSRPSVA
jgi:SAM-dependent methyltransferase